MLARRAIVNTSIVCKRPYLIGLFMEITVTYVWKRANSIALKPKLKQSHNGQSEKSATKNRWRKHRCARSLLANKLVSPTSLRVGSHTSHLAFFNFTSSCLQIDTPQVSSPYRLVPPTIHKVYGSVRPQVNWPTDQFRPHGNKHIQGVNARDQVGISSDWLGEWS